MWAFQQDNNSKHTVNETNGFREGIKAARMAQSVMTKIPEDLYLSMRPGKPQDTLCRRNSPNSRLSDCDSTPIAAVADDLILLDPSAAVDLQLSNSSYLGIPGTVLN